MMKDIQNQRDYRNIPIDKVGIKNLRYPITVLDRRNGYQHTVASINMYVDLPHKNKGTHMSRFVEILHLFRPEISLKRISDVLDEMKKHLNAASAHIEVTFPYFIKKNAPVSDSPGLMDYTCKIAGPCSKEISEFGAHNQRGEVKVGTRFKKFIWMEDMIELVEESASCDVYSVLKRVDEKCVTEKGFSNPKFVEDIVRDISKKLYDDDNITWFSVSAENFESIHNHSAFAHIISKKGN